MRTTEPPLYGYGLTVCPDCGDCQEHTIYDDGNIPDLITMQCRCGVSSEHSLHETCRRWVAREYEKVRDVMLPRPKRLRPLKPGDLLYGIEKTI